MFIVQNMHVYKVVYLYFRAHFPYLTRISTFSLLQEAQKCIHTGRTTHPVKLTHSGCRSLKKFRLKHCESCSHEQCCRPDKTRTLLVHFRCKNGATFRRKVLMTESCSCDVSCSSTNEKPHGLYRLFNEINKPKM